jgi:hypothetical protein
MGVADRYGRDKNGNVIRDGEDLSKKRAGFVDIDVFIQQSYAQAVKNQNGQRLVKKERIVTSQDIRFAKEGYAANNKVDYIDTKNNQYKYPGKDYVCPQPPVKQSLLSKIKTWLKLK